jgi:signal transduction histidine kinase
MKRLISIDSIASRTFLVLLVGLTISHALSVTFYFTDRVSALILTGGEHVGERIATITRLVENTSEGERQRIVDLANGPTLHVTWDKQTTIKEGDVGGWQAEVLRNALHNHFGEAADQNFRIRYDDANAGQVENRRAEGTDGASLNGGTFSVSLRLPDSSWLNFTAPLAEPEPFWSYRFLLSMAVMIVAVVILSAMVVYRLTAPLRVFAQAAHRLGTDVNAAPLNEAGPIEVRRASNAFNEMQRRIRRFVEDRTQMIAAISHDLGTPITRLRLRAEFIEDQEQKQKTLADLEEMNRMISSTLTFARDDSVQEPRTLVDLAALIRSVCGDLSDAGLMVECEQHEPLSYSCRPTALRRALTNLIENAAKYGERARISIIDGGQDVTVQIDDLGPGIPEDQLENVFRPFHRLEGSRSRQTGGTGLGLTVARTIVRAHGGEIVLQNRSGRGLRVQVTLPR